MMRNNIAIQDWKGFLDAGSDGTKYKKRRTQIMSEIKSL